MTYAMFISGLSSRRLPQRGHRSQDTAMADPRPALGRLSWHRGHGRDHGKELLREHGCRGGAGADPAPPGWDRGRPASADPPGEPMRGDGPERPVTIPSGDRGDTRNTGGDQG